MTARGLIPLTGIRSLSTIRRGLEGLMVKLSIERELKHNDNGKRDCSAYRVYTPDEILIRRRQSSSSDTNVLKLSQVPNYSFERAVARVAENQMLSRREAEVALCCVEGLTNAEIGKFLDVTEQTVNFTLGMSSLNLVLSVELS
jgi:DNA-binding CsgD family transcriptional regulator